MGRKIFITATDTNAGKTYVTSRLVQSLLQQKKPALAIKPVACGTSPGETNEDVVSLMQAQKISDSNHINLYDFAVPAAPSLAAAEAGKEIDPRRLIRWCNVRTDESEICLIEGVGGLMVPLTNHYLVSDWLTDLKSCEIMLVIGVRLGCINHAILTLKQLSRMQCPPDYIVINALDQSSDSEQVRLALNAYLPKNASVHVIPNLGSDEVFHDLAKVIVANK